ncbi:MAG: hypothetical protein HGA40_02845 [Methanoregulaceae archaeon]|nr:hypothetical protein [Methanoregulaceae archaeon]
MTLSLPVILSIHLMFLRHDRKYCIFQVTGRDDDFLYYSHTSRPLRSLMIGRNFLDQLPGLMEREELCIECGLGLSVKGGVARDTRDLIAWHCTVEEANRILIALKQKLGEEGRWIEPF